MMNGGTVEIKEETSLEEGSRLGAEIVLGARHDASSFLKAWFGELRARSRGGGGWVGGGRKLRWVCISGGGAVTTTVARGDHDPHPTTSNPFSLKP
jgi:hypothetical protein